MLWKCRKDGVLSYVKPHFSAVTNHGIDHFALLVHPSTPFRDMYSIIHSVTITDLPKQKTGVASNVNWRSDFKSPLHFIANNPFSKNNFQLTENLSVEHSPYAP